MKQLPWKHQVLILVFIF
ncbi:MAG: hypothetical protein KBC58_08545 [Flavobacterium sp.]|nr:hypothetical protein [Flavobacterium sp.]TAF12136.1 MAG: hypothetical protein EAZ75_03210 [Flavobacteriia bacterium]